MECGKKYYVRASLEDYTTKEVSVIIKKETGNTELNIELKSEGCKVKIGDDLDSKKNNNSRLDKLIDYIIKENNPAFAFYCANTYNYKLHIF